MSALGQQRTWDKLASVAIRITSTACRGLSGAHQSKRLRSKPKPYAPPSWAAPTSNGTRFPYLVSLLGPEGKSHMTWHRASSSSLQSKGASCQLYSGEVKC